MSHGAGHRVTTLQCVLTGLVERALEIEFWFWVTIFICVTGGKSPRCRFLSCWKQVCWIKSWHWFAGRLTHEQDVHRRGFSLAGFFWPYDQEPFTDLKLSNPQFSYSVMEVPGCHRPVGTDPQNSAALPSPSPPYSHWTGPLLCSVTTVFTEKADEKIGEGNEESGFCDLGTEEPSEGSCRVMCGFLGLP